MRFINRQDLRGAYRATRRGSVAFIIMTASALAACDQQPQQASQTAAPPPAVVVVAAERRDITSSTDFVGRVEAVDKVDLRARVEGFLENRAFEEGKPVQQGDLLFQIQQSEFRATVDQAKAELAAAEARKTNSAGQLARALTLLQKKDVPEAEVDRRRAEDQMAEANVLQAKAALEKAELNLAYTEIRSPINGRIGRAAYTVGNLVGPDSGVLATIVSQDPIYVVFAVSQRILLDVQKQARAGGGKAKDDNILRLILADGSTYPQPGKIDFADIQISESTDTLSVRGSFPNPLGQLIDGQFVTLSVEADTPEQAVVIPQVALQADQAGVFVLAVRDDNTAEIRRVKTGAAQGAMIAVEEGLKEGERVIVEGAQKVRPGQAVEASIAPAARSGG